MINGTIVLRHCIARTGQIRFPYTHLFATFYFKVKLHAEDERLLPLLQPFSPEADAVAIHVEERLVGTEAHALHHQQEAERDLGYGGPVLRDAVQSLDAVAVRGPRHSPLHPCDLASVDKGEPLKVLHVEPPARDELAEAAREGVSARPCLARDDGCHHSNVGTRSVPLLVLSAVPPVHDGLELRQRAAPRELLGCVVVVVVPPVRLGEVACHAFLCAHADVGAVAAGSRGLLLPDVHGE